MLSAVGEGKPGGGSCSASTWNIMISPKGSTSLIRATEGTIVERLPPRMKIRTGAALGTAPHPRPDR